MPHSFHAYFEGSGVKAHFLLFFYSQQFAYGFVDMPVEIPRRDNVDGPADQQAVYALLVRQRYGFVYADLLVDRFRDIIRHF
jgi:hypothetical protein